ncbi:WcaF family extracellular polysaccharide biosynthesis acetyltransferase [Ignavibacterium sp.]|uniref:WcaF family extracellular polysaccharide biosynthesis acetyltransferase n=1 Tax=Ignavibacterium sp. TaxID=2651167 RepID=UPI0022016E19|nr:WcaF family extracellular polysaccharide biosynthesis acetyltransferase [Ignavibacterium sp.]BDQ01731.1 MAG: colanic acid biosynthesis acetyltransferase WcaF [Ignavibacterium sp.]
MKVDLKNWKPGGYSPGSKWKIVLWNFINIVLFINPLNASYRFKSFILRAFGAKVGKGVIFKQNISIKYPWFLEIGDDVWIGERVWIDNLGKVKIGNNVCISQGAMLLTGNHNYKKTTFDLMVGEITLEEGVWVGAKSVVCPGVTMRSHSILTVGSVLTKDADEYGIYQGVPAVFIKKRDIQD